MDATIAVLVREIEALRAEVERMKTQEGGALLRSGGTMTGALLLPDGSAAAPAAAFANDADIGMYRYGTNRLGLATNGIVRMAINDVGNIGINTTSQAATFHVNAVAPGTSALIIRSAPSPTVDVMRVQDSGGATQFSIASDGKLKTNQSSVNTNTPAGATARQLAIYGTGGGLLGYVPIYGSAW